MEIDGKMHDCLKESDNLRSQVMNSLGIEVVRFRNSEIENNLDKVLNKLRTHLKV